MSQSGGHPECWLCASAVRCGEEGGASEILTDRALKKKKQTLLLTVETKKIDLIHLDQPSKKQKVDVER